MKTIGTILKTLRTQRGKSCADMARATRIPRTILEQLEEDSLEGLPAPVYIRGFIQSYCRVLEFDPTEAVKIYDQQSQVDSRDESELTMESLLPHVGNVEMSKHAGLSLVHAVVLLAAALTFLVAIFSTGNDPEADQVAEHESNTGAIERDVNGTTSPDESR